MVIVSARGVIAATLLIGFYSGNVIADAAVVKGGDEFTGSTYRGLVLPSNNSTASVYFLCDSSETRPRIVFSNTEFLTASGNTFSLAYRIDEQPIARHTFKSRPDHKSGEFAIVYESRYTVRYGQPPTPPSTGNHIRDAELTLKQFDSWKNRIFHGFITDFLKGDTALVRVWDFNKKPYNYRISLSGISRNISALEGCYTP